MTLTPHEIRLRTWTPRELVRSHDFFIQAKGLHAGRPMNESCANCFIVPCKSEEQREQLFGLTLALWHARGFQFYILGSVIPFIRLRDAEGLLNHAYEKYRENPDEHQRQINTIFKLDQLEKIKNHEVDTIRQLKITIAKKHFGDHPDLHARARKRSL